jgi:hypothetical protein
VIKVITYNGIGGYELQLTFDAKNNHPINRLATLKVSDSDLSEVIQRGLERLAGQGKVDEKLRLMCHCLGEIK